MVDRPHEEHLGVRSDPIGLPYQPALDGLRGIAVTMVLLFHGAVSWASGGYLGVSLFFTLSGYLITRLVIHEHDVAGRVSLRRFYGRRIRRLLPASTATVLLVISGTRWHLLAASQGLESTVRWSVAQLANWHQLASGNSYAGMFADGPSQSPMAHYWSLAIEEQFYLVAPILLIVGLRWWRPRMDQISIAAFVAAATTAIVTAQLFGPDAAYFSTPARASELLAGVALATVLHSRQVPVWLGRMALPALLAVLAIVATTGATDSAWPYRGALPAFALLSASLIASLQSPSAVLSVLSTRPLVAVGRISYGLYLYHWPVYGWLTADRVGVDGVWLLVVRLAVSVAFATVSYAVLEQPIRRARLAWRPTLATAVTTQVALVAVAAVALVQVTGAITSTSQIDPERLAAVALPATTEAPGPSPTIVVPAVAAPTSTHTAEPTSTVPAPQPLRVMVVGDSTAVALGAGLVDVASSSPGSMQVGVEASGACGLVRGGHFRYDVFDSALQMACPDLLDHRIPSQLAAVTPDVVVVLVSLADTWERSWDGGDTWLDANDPEFRERLRADYAVFFETLIEAGVPHIVWLRPPVTSFDDRGSGDPRPDASFLDGGQEVVQSVVAEQAQLHPGLIEQLDLRAWMEQSGLADATSVRPDGTHLSQAGAADVVRRWLTPELTRIVE
ncbi:MAG: acyltransferase [Actinobacteria bacterium]|nr:acyltransferase [Actinomycetota bacterium]